MPGTCTSTNIPVCLVLVLVQVYKYHTTRERRKKRQQSTIRTETGRVVSKYFSVGVNGTGRVNLFQQAYSQAAAARAQSSSGRLQRRQGAIEQRKDRIHREQRRVVQPVPPSFYVNLLSMWIYNMLDNTTSTQCCLLLHVDPTISLENQQKSEY
jgi:hypothetical protein